MAARLGERMSDDAFDRPNASEQLARGLYNISRCSRQTQMELTCISHPVFSFRLREKRPHHLVNPLSHVLKTLQVLRLQRLIETRGHSALQHRLVVTVRTSYSTYQIPHTGDVIK